MADPRCVDAQNAAPTTGRRALGVVAEIVRNSIVLWCLLLAGLGVATIFVH